MLETLNPKQIREMEIEYPPMEIGDNNTIITGPINGSAFYEIDLDRIQKPLDLVRWLHHMNDKVWFTALHNTMLIEAVCRTKGWKLHR